MKVVWRRGRTPNTLSTYCFIDIFLLNRNSTPHFTPQILLKNVVFKSGVLLLKESLNQFANQLKFFKGSWVIVALSVALGPRTFDGLAKSLELNYILIHRLLARYCLTYVYACLTLSIMTRLYQNSTSKGPAMGFSPCYGDCVGIVFFSWQACC